MFPTRPSSRLNAHRPSLGQDNLNIESMLPAFCAALKAISAAFTSDSLQILPKQAFLYPPRFAGLLQRKKVHFRLF
jgi:hypothetical protein